MQSKIRKSIAVLLLPALFACAKEDAKVLAADSNKTPEQVRTEAATLDKTELEKAVEQYKAEIAKVQAKFDDLQKQVNALDPAAAIGDAGKQLHADFQKATDELAKLTANLAVYQDELAKKK